MKSAPVISTCRQGIDAVATVRALCGITRSREAAPGTIRGDLAMSVQLNVVYDSDTPDAAKAAPAASSVSQSAEAAKAASARNSRSMAVIALAHVRTLCER